MTFEDRFSALRGLSTAPAPPLEDLQRRSRRRHRSQLLTSGLVALVIVVALGLVVAARNQSHGSGLATVGQPPAATTTVPASIPVVTAAVVTASHVPSGYQLVHQGVGGSSIVIFAMGNHGTVPASDQGRPGGPRSLYSLNYLRLPVTETSAATSPQAILVTASTEADYPPGYLDQWSHSNGQLTRRVGGRLTTMDLEAESAHAIFVEQGVLVDVEAQGLTLPVLEQFVAGLHVTVTG